MCFSNYSFQPIQQTSQRAARVESVFQTRFWWGALWASVTTPTLSAHIWEAAALKEWLISLTERGFSQDHYRHSCAGCLGLCWHLLDAGINTSAVREAAMGYFVLLSSPSSGDWWQLLQPIWLSLINTANWTANCSHFVRYAHSICFERWFHPQIRKGVENNYLNESDD